MSTVYEELVERIAHMADKHQGGSGWWPRDIQFARDILAEIFRTLEAAALNEHGETWPDDLIDWVRDCPFAPPKTP